MSDDELLRSLATSFAVESCEPDAAALQHLAQAVAALHPTPPTARRARRWTVPQHLTPALIAGAVVGIVGAGTGISYAVGTPLPTAVRSIARSVGLASPATPPTTPLTSPPPISPALNAARQAESTLHQALAANHPTAGIISRDSSTLARRLAAFGAQPGPESSGTTADGHHLLNEACRQLGGSGQWDATYGTAVSGGTNGVTDPTGVHCTAVGVGVGSHPTGPDNTGPSNTAVTVPSNTSGSGPPTPTQHSGAGTSGGPVKATTGGVSGAGFNRTTPGTTPLGPAEGHGAHDSSRGRSSHGPSGSDTISHTGNPEG
jgi:hypothetical protein